MGTATKRQICEDAFAELALSGAVFELSPEEMQTALGRLDRMVAWWESEKDIHLGYALPDPLLGSALDDESGVPDGAVQPLVTNLAVRLASVWGKQLSQDTRNAAKLGYDALLARAAAPRPAQMPATLPRGAGNKPWRNSAPFFDEPDTGPMLNSEGGALDIVEG